MNSVYLLWIKRRSGTITGVELYENVQVEVIDNFRVSLSKESRAFRLKINEKIGLKVSRIAFEERPYVLIPWYDEKYVFCQTGDILDKACALGLPDQFVTWLAGRM